MFDCHVHSNFSSDSAMQAETACEKALQKGLSGIAFTDHLDIDFPDTYDYNNIDFNIYSEFMDTLKYKQHGTLKVLKGIEVGIQPHVIGDSRKIVESHAFDYVIGSIHIIDGIDPYEGKYYEDKAKIEAYGRYLLEVLFLIRNFKNYDNIGHFEYITRCACYDDRTLRYNEHIENFDEIFKELINEGKGFEVNTGSFRDKQGMRTADYDISVLKRYRELGGEIISLGSDAHSLDHIGYKFDLFREILIEAGFRYETYFENRKPVFIPLIR